MRRPCARMERLTLPERVTAGSGTQQPSRTAPQTLHKLRALVALRRLQVTHTQGAFDNKATSIPLPAVLVKLPHLCCNTHTSALWQSALLSCNSRSWTGMSRLHCDTTARAPSCSVLVVQDAPPPPPSVAIELVERQRWCSTLVRNVASPSRYVFFQSCLALNVASTESASMYCHQIRPKVQQGGAWTRPGAHWGHRGRR